MVSGEKRKLSTMQHWPWSSFAMKGGIQKTLKKSNNAAKQKRKQSTNVAKCHCLHITWPVAAKAFIAPEAIEAVLETDVSVLPEGGITLEVWKPKKTTKKGKKHNYQLVQWHFVVLCERRNFMQWETENYQHSHNEG